jgi:hypothetical protein
LTGLPRDVDAAGVAKKSALQLDDNRMTMKNKKAGARSDVALHDWIIVSLEDLEMVCEK